MEDAATPGGLGGRGTGPRVSRAALKVRAHVFRGARVPAQRSTDVLPDALVALQWSDWRVLLVTGRFPHFRFLQRFCTGDCQGGRGAASSPSAASSPHGLLPPSHAPRRRVGAQLHWPFAVDLESGLLGLPMVSWLRVFPRVGLLGALLQDMQTTLSWGLLALLCSGAPFIARRGSGVQKGKWFRFKWTHV